MHAGAELPIHGDGLHTRSYLFVEDVAEAFDLILHKVMPMGAVELTDRGALCVCPPVPHRVRATAAWLPLS